MHLDPTQIVRPLLTLAVGAKGELESSCSLDGSVKYIYIPSLNLAVVLYIKLLSQNIPSRISE